MAGRGERGKILQRRSDRIDPVSRRLFAVANCLRPLGLGETMLKLGKSA